MVQIQPSLYDPEQKYKYYIIIDNKKLDVWAQYRLLLFFPENFEEKRDL